VAEPRARSAAQREVDTTALQAVERLAGTINGHISLDDERFGTIKRDMIEIKGDVKQLNNDARDAIKDLDDKQALNHRDNQTWMQRLELKIDGMSARSAGVAWLGLTIRDWLILIVALAAFIANVLRHP
jgi:hypothetical protein